MVVVLNDPTSPVEIIVTSAFGLESVVRHELTALGYQSVMLEPGRQLIVAPLAAVCRANLFLRCAERVLIRVGHFDARDFDRLFEGAQALPWERWIPPDGQFPVKAKSIKSQLTSVPALQRSVKKAVALRLQQAHAVATLDESGAAFAIEAALYNDWVTLTLDTSGTGLHKRGYRPAAGMAPLRETLAAAMVMLAHWHPELPLIDPFCGSGTLPIEAALWGRSLAPGRQRQFAAESWPTFSPAPWHEARQEAADLERPALPQRLLGTDRNAAVLDKARLNAAAAGVADDLHFQQRSFSELTSSRKFGCLICNPPYGHRLGGSSAEARQLDALYRSMPLVLRRLPTWSHYILTAVPDFETLIGQRASKRRKLYNGRIECQFYQFFGPRSPFRHTSRDKTSETTPSPESPTEPAASDRQPDAVNTTPESRPPAMRETASRQAFGGLHTAAMRQAEEFANRLQKRARHLRRWPQKGVHCYRLYERDVPDVPLVVDRYEDWLHMAEFARPHERTRAENADWLDLMKQTAAKALDINPDHVVMKRRQRQRLQAQYERLQETNQELPVRERELTFLVNLVDYLDTGLFLDHRETRRMFGQEARGKDVLNLFAYTGTFSVYAAAAGAASTRSVDISPKYLEWAQRNFAVNQIPLGKIHRFVTADALTYLRDLHRDVAFDLAVVDPPTFSNRKELTRDWDVQRDHVPLLTEVGQRIRPGGVVFFSTNFRRFKFQPDGLPFASVHEISRQTVPEDFRNRRIHRCWRLIR